MKSFRWTPLLTCSERWLVHPGQTAPWFCALGQWNRWSPLQIWARLVRANQWTGTDALSVIGHPEGVRKWWEQRHKKNKKRKLACWSDGVSEIFSTHIKMFIPEMCSCCLCEVIISKGLFKELLLAVLTEEWDSARQYPFLPLMITVIWPWISGCG